MANNLLPAATTLFLLLLTLATADTDGDLVLDVDGNPLEVGSEYYIQRAIGFFGGIGRAPRNSRSVCPLYVVQLPSELDRGDPLKFVPVNGTQTEIHLSSDVQIDSGRSALCWSDGFWRVSFDGLTRDFVIIAAGSSSIPPSSFRIEKSTEGSLNAYKIVYHFPSLKAYLTIIPDHFSRLNLVGLTLESSEALPFIFSKIKKDVVTLSLYVKDLVG